MATQDTQYQLKPGESVSEYYSRLPGSAPGSTTTGVARPGIDVPASSVAPASGTPMVKPPTPTPAPVEMPSTALPKGTSQADVDAARTAQYATKTPEQAAEDYRTSALKSAADRISNIEGIYSQKLQSELEAQRPASENILGRTKSLSAMMGLAGSSAADTRAAGAEANVAEITKGITSKVQAEKMNALNAIYNNIDSGAQKMYEAQIETNKTNQKKLLDDMAASGLSNLTAIASHIAPLGKTFDDFKNSDGGQALNNLMQQTGKTEYELRRAWDASLPDNLKPVEHVTYKDDGSGGTIMSRVSFNPISKKVTTEDTNIPAPVSTFSAGEKPIEVNGMLLVKQPDGTYKNMAPSVTKPEWKEVGTDEFGNKKFGWVTPPAAGASAGKVGAEQKTTGTPTPPAGQEMFTDFLKDKTPAQVQAFNSLPNNIVRTDVMSLVNGDVLISDIAKGIGGAKKAEAYNAYAKQIDPNYSENVNKQRYSFKTKWNDSAGKAYQARLGINNALAHMAKLNELSAQLKNIDFKKYNSVANMIAENINTPGVADAIAQFQDTVNLLGTEIARAYKGGVPDENEIKQQQNSLNSSRPENIVQSVLNNKAYLMSSAMKNMTSEYKRTMGKNPDEPLVNSNILDEFKGAGLDESILIKNFPIGSKFEYGGKMIMKNGEDDYEIVQ